MLQGTRQGDASGWEPLKLFQKAPHSFGDMPQGLYDPVHGEWLQWAEHYAKGCVNLLIVTRERGREGVHHGPTYKVLIFDADPAKVIIQSGVGRGGVKFPETEIFHVGEQGGGGKYPVFVGDTQLMESPQIFVPSTVRARIADYSDDIFSGEMYESIANRGLKGVRVIDEWPLDLFGIARTVGRDKCPDNVVQGRTKVMGGISDQQSETVWDGFVNFNKQGSLACFGLFLENNGVVRGEERIHLRFEVIDVMFGTREF